MHTCMTHGISYVDLLTFVRLTLVIHRAIEKELDLDLARSTGRVESTSTRLTHSTRRLAHHQS